MPRPLRKIRPGGLYHVINRAQAHAPLFEGEADVQRWQSLLAWVSGRQSLQVLALSVLTTHFHMLVETRDGNLAADMQAVQDKYARHYNRTRERGGHVFRGRYFAREVRDPVDLVMTVDYIDWNPVEAGMCSEPIAYPFGSARIYAGQADMPWLSRDLLERLAMRLAGTHVWTPEAYGSIWRHAGRANAREIVRRALRQGMQRPLQVGALAHLGSEAMRAWLQDELVREEGRCEASLVVPGDVVLQAPAPTGVEEAGRVAMRAGMLRVLAGWTQAEIAAALGLSLSAAARACARHGARMCAEQAYAGAVAEWTMRLVDALYGEMARTLRGFGREWGLDGLGGESGSG
ncbi:MAG: transposase, partial [Planctomycetia bacterium]